MSYPLSEIISKDSAFFDSVPLRTSMTCPLAPFPVLLLWLTIIVSLETFVVSIIISIFKTILTPTRLLEDLWVASEGDFWPSYFQDSSFQQSPIDDKVNACFVLQPIINSLEQILVESNDVNEPNIIERMGSNLQSVPCQMALLNVCLKSVGETATIDTIISEEAYSTTSFLHEIGTRVLIRCMEHTTINIVLETARAMVKDISDTPSFLVTASNSLAIAKQHMLKQVNTI